MDLPLIGGHAPGVAARQDSETLVNLIVEPSNGPEKAYLRNRYGYQQFADIPDDNDGAGTEWAITDINATGTTVLVTMTDTRDHGYEVGDSVTISGSAVGAYNAAHTITARTKLTLTFEVTPAPADDLATSATLVMTGGIYAKEVRALFRQSLISGNAESRIIAVVGNRFYRIKSDATVEFAIADDRFNSFNGQVSVAFLGPDLTDGAIVTDGVSAVAEGVTPITMIRNAGGFWDDPATPLAESNTATTMDGYVIRDDKGNRGRFQYSDLYDVNTENAFNFATAEGSPDDLIAVLADRRELWLFGEYTTEIWYNAGNKDLPFQRFQGGFVQLGIAAPLTAKKFDNSIAWLAQDKRGALTVVRAGEGFQPTMISTTQINTEIEKLHGYVFNAFAEVMRIEGHEFYVLTFPGKYGLDSGQSGRQSVTPTTFVYDSVFKLWAKWESHDDLLATVDHGRFMMTAHSYVADNVIRELNSTIDFENRHFIGGRDKSGYIMELDPEYHIDQHPNGNQNISCERTMPVVEGPDLARFNLGPVELITNFTAGASRPSVGLSYAKDGVSFTTPVTRIVTINTTRLMWKRMGRARRWIMRVTQETAATHGAGWIRLISRGAGQ